MDRCVLLILSSALIASNLQAQPPLDEVACYSFDDGDAQDGSGFGHHGTPYGATLTADRYGLADHAYHFNGVSDRIEVPDFGSFNITGEVSIGVWVRAEAVNGNFAVSIWPDDFNDRLAAAPYYGHLGGCTIFWDFGDCTAGGRSNMIPYPFASTWDHFTFTSSAENDRMRVYLNGVLIHEENHHSTLVNVDRLLEIGGGRCARLYALARRPGRGGAVRARVERNRSS